MEEIVKISSIAQYNTMRGVPTKHPLVALIDLSKAQPMPAKSFNFGLYAVGLKELHSGQLRYGRRHYDYQEGSLIFIAPGQVLGVQPGIELFAPTGWALLFHPDLLNGTPLGKYIQDYSFFSYDVYEALHLSDREKSMVLDCFSKIEYELEQNIDKHSKRLIVANIALLLDYCIRFYDRQFITRDNANRGILERFEYLLKDYFSSDKPQREGLPSVAYCAEALHLSPNYFGDLIKKETGRSALEYIQSKVIEVAKERLFDMNKTASEIAYELGFRYPQHFTRLFKQRAGVTPNDYRMMN
ncbi:transcriptional regulator (plasmid) [Hymenobacter psoromatis]|nr:transcriptional regulator [Hymenobacter psoromatis]